MSENDDVFDKAETVKTSEQVEQKPVQASEPIDFPQEINFSDKSVEDKRKEYGEHINCDGQILTIVEVKPMAPKLTEFVNNKVVKIPPTESKNGKSHYYSAKLKVKYDNNMVAFLPNISYFCDKDGNLQLDKDTHQPIPTINVRGYNQVSILAKKVLNLMSGNKFQFKEIMYNFRPSIVPTQECEAAFFGFADTVSPGRIANFMIGKKVKIKTLIGTTESGKEFFRNDIEAFV